MTNDRLEAGRRRGTLEIEDFVGTFLLDAFELLKFHVTRSTDNYQSPGVRLHLNDDQYDFVCDDGWSPDKKLGSIRRHSRDHVALYGCEDFKRHEGPLVVNLFNRWDVLQTTIARNRRVKPERLTFDAKMIYATCDNIDGKVLFELGDEIVQIKHRPGWAVRFVSRYYPEGIVPDYLQQREEHDPDQVPPVEIIGTYKPYEPKGGRKRGRQLAEH